MLYFSKTPESFFVISKTSCQFLFGNCCNPALLKAATVFNQNTVNALLQVSIAPLRYRSVAGTKQLSQFVFTEVALLLNNYKHLQCFKPGWKTFLTGS